jgi:hypothetical protein
MGARRKKSKKPSGTRAEQLLETTIFYADRCLGRQVPEALRAAGLKVEVHRDHFADDTPDEDWLAQVGARLWVVLTKDKAIRRKASEREAVMAANIRLFTLPSGNLTGQEMAEIYLQNRLGMARFLHRQPGPFVAVVSRTGIVLVATEPAEEDQLEP